MAQTLNYKITASTQVHFRVQHVTMVITCKVVIEILLDRIGMYSFWISGKYGLDAELLHNRPNAALDKTYLPSIEHIVCKQKPLFVYLSDACA